MADQEAKPPTPEAEQKPGSPVTDKPPTPEQQQEPISGQTGDGDRKSVSPTEQIKSTDDAGRKSRSPVEEEIPQKSESPDQKEGSGEISQNAGGDEEPGDQKEEPSKSITYFFYFILPIIYCLCALK